MSERLEAKLYMEQDFENKTEVTYDTRNDLILMKKFDSYLKNTSKWKAKRISTKKYQLKLPEKWPSFGPISCHNFPVYKCLLLFENFLNMGTEEGIEKKQKILDQTQLSYSAKPMKLKVFSFLVFKWKILEMHEILKDKIVIACIFALGKNYIAFVSSTFF